MMRKFLFGVGLTLSMLVLSAGSAFAQIDTGAVAAVDAGASSLRDTLVEIATTVLPYAVAIIAILLGWRLARRFIRA